MSKPRSRLLDILRGHSVARKVLGAPAPDLGLAELEPFPFLAIVGQQEMKLALTLAIINPLVGGVLLVGSRGTAKSTAVRSLTDLLPLQRYSSCENGCTEEILDAGGMEAICDDCIQRVGYGEPLTVEEKVRIVELPLNARLDDVVGGIGVWETPDQPGLQKGILAQADGNVLYSDEVNLLADEVTDAILDAAAQGYFTVQRGSASLKYNSRFLLVGSMNPAEGQLRPQIMDRFGLRAVVRGLSDPEMRYRAYEQAVAHNLTPDELAAAYADQTLALTAEVGLARERLENVTIGPLGKQLGLELIQELGIDSNRAEITLFEAARAYAAADERDAVLPEDVEAVAHMSLRLRNSADLGEFFGAQEAEDERVRELINESKARDSSGSQSSPT
jgi:magnesium chelatase subunit I